MKSDRGIFRSSVHNSRPLPTSLDLYPETLPRPTMARAALLLAVSVALALALDANATIAATAGGPRNLRRRLDDSNLDAALAELDSAASSILEELEEQEDLLGDYHDEEQDQPQGGPMDLDLEEVLEEVLEEEDEDGTNMDGMNMDGMNTDEEDEDEDGMNMDGMNMDGMNMNQEDEDEDGMNMDGVNMDGMNMDGMNMDGMNMDGEGEDEDDEDVEGGGPDEIPNTDIVGPAGEEIPSAIYEEQEPIVPSEFTDRFPTPAPAPVANSIPTPAPAPMVPRTASPTANWRKYQTMEPTAAYHPPSEILDPLDGLASERPSSAGHSGPFEEGSWAEEEYEEGYSWLDGEPGQESLDELVRDSRVQVAVGVLLGIGGLMAIVTGAMISSNPDGLCGSVCTLLATVILCPIRTICLPCRYMCCWNQKDYTNRHGASLIGRNDLEFA